MNSDIRFYVANTDHALTREFWPTILFYGQLCGPVISGEFAGSQMIKVVEAPDWAPFKYGDQFVGRLIPSSLTAHGFDFPVRDLTTDGYRKFLVYTNTVEEDTTHLIASADSYADALEHAYAHARFANHERRYIIVDRDKAEVICQAMFHPDDAANSWAWGAAT
jgi:hypothetical protein